MGGYKIAFSALVPWCTTKIKTYYLRPRPKHQGLKPRLRLRQWKLHLKAALRRGSASAQGTTSLSICIWRSSK